ncbi:tocopherol cyclase family protein [Clostridium malenominatum]|uniref:Tocopherol cyclase family protein n=1 Tax=Clostridium malenominatum TaxID=1539 RepID=A0ABP3TU70_9CLOT
MIKQILNPDLFHKKSRRKSYFEGWYFKLVDKEEKNSYVFIPGIFYSKDDNYSHAFIQVLCGEEVLYYYNKYSKESFKWSNNKFLINIEKNIFSAKGIQLDINNENINVEGKILFKDLVKWPDSKLNPGSMGFYNYIQFMQCYSQVSSIDMNLQGYLNINDRKINFTGGKGYIEKNWGRDFPYAWIWVQCNNFSNNTSLTCSIGQVPFLLGSFDGFLIGVLIEDTFHKFTTINGSNLRTWWKNGDFIMECRNKKYTLHIITETNKEDYVICNAPREDKMIPLAKETLKGKVFIKLICNRTGSTIYEDMGICAGIEYGGRVEELIKN